MRYTNNSNPARIRLSVKREIQGTENEAQKSYDAFNARIEKMLNAGVVPLYPSLEHLDAMLASIVIK